MDSLWPREFVHNFGVTLVRDLTSTRFEIIQWGLAIVRVLAATELALRTSSQIPKSERPLLYSIVMH